MAARASQAAAWFAGLALVALHFSPWNPMANVQPLLGWLPAELVWRWLWMALAWAYLLWFAAKVWETPE